MVNEDGAEGRRAAATVVGRARRSPWPALSVEEALHLVEDHVSVLGGTRKVAITNVKAGRFSKIRTAALLMSREICWRGTNAFVRPL